jgi:hypothetical protein
MLKIFRPIYSTCFLFSFLLQLINRRLDYKDRDQCTGGQVVVFKFVLKILGASGVSVLVLFSQIFRGEFRSYPIALSSEVLQVE